MTVSPFEGNRSTSKIESTFMLPTTRMGLEGSAPPRRRSKGCTIRSKETGRVGGFNDLETSARLATKSKIRNHAHGIIPPIVVWKKTENKR